MNGWAYWLSHSGSSKVIFIYLYEQFYFLIFQESLCPCGAYCNILSLKNPVALKEKERVTKHGFLPCLWAMRRKIQSRFMSHDMDFNMTQDLKIFI